MVLTLSRLGAGNFDEQRRDHGRVADEGACGGHADGVHPGHLGCGALERGYDAVIMVLGVCLELGEPDDFLGVDALAVDHGRDLPVGTAGVEADAAAVQIAADGFGDRDWRPGQSSRGRSTIFQIPLIELVEERIVKMPLALGS